MKTKIDIIQETVQFYSEDVSRRAVIANDEGKIFKCVYQTEDGRNCALGKYLIDPEAETLRNYAASSLFVENSPETFDILKPEARIEDRYFWIDLQMFHDYGENWTETGLSKEGERKVEILLEKYKN